MIWFFILILLLLIGALAWKLGGRGPRPSREILLGKTFGKLLDGRRDDVLEEMRNLYQESGQDVGIGLALGILLRHLGKNQAAIRTHRSLMSRTQLETELKALLLTELAADYLASGLLDRAKASLEEGLTLKVQDELMTRFGERIYSKLNAWDDAFQLIQTYGKKTGEPVAPRLALIRNEQAVYLQDKGEVEAAHALFRKAVSIDSACLPAYLNRASLLRERGEPQKAAKLILKKLSFFKGQEWLAFGELCACALELDQSSILFEPLDQHLQAEPEDWRSMMVWANFETHVGQYQKAAEWYLKALSLSPQTLLLHQRLWSVMLRCDEVDSLLKTYQAQVREDMVFSAPYECQGCHFHSHQLLWRCPSCFRQYSFRERSL